MHKMGIDLDIRNHRTNNRTRCLARLVYASLVLFTFFNALSAHAQIHLTSRAELTNESDITYIGKSIYLTKDAENKLDVKTIVSRHQSNLRGQRTNSNIINLGLTNNKAWLLFSVTNNSGTENWVLDFGNIWTGRLALAHKITVVNNSTDTTYIQATRSKNTPNSFGEQLNGSALPITIRKGKTELFVMYFEPEGGLPNTISPRLIKEKTYLAKLKNGSWLQNLSHIFFISVIAFFLALVSLNKRPEFLLTSGFYILNYMLFLSINSIFFAKYAITGEILIFLFSLSTINALAIGKVFLRIRLEEYAENTMIYALSAFVAVSSLLSVFIFREQSIWASILISAPAIISFLILSLISFTQAKKGKFGGQLFTLAWLILAIGLALTSLAVSGIIPPHFTINAYWISLIPHAICLMIASARKIKLLEEDVKHRQAKESRAAQSKARLEQSKESADQARLLRVIERERELMADLREREMQRTEEMRHAKEMADGANKAKSAFLAVVSHEIRTPMTGIMGIVRLLNETKLTEEQMDYMLAIRKSGDTMMTLLNDILDFEKIETGLMKLEEIDFDLPKLVQGVVTLMSGHAADKGISLDADIAESLPRYVVGDPMRLRQVLLNLVNNALKFTQQGGVTIRLRATPIDKNEEMNIRRFEVYFAVEDTGIGISEEAQRNLFNPFEQADASVSRKFGGTGLGLAICHRLIDTMGSAIQVSSDESAGSTFYFVIDMDEGSAELSEESEIIGTATIGRHQTLAKGLHILVIEDNEINRKVLQNFLEKDDHYVDVSESAEDALNKIKKKTFDVIFTDIQLTGISGLEFTREIRAMDAPDLANIPIIAITGNVSDEDQQKAIDAGVNDVIPKPIDYDTLRQSLLAFTPEPEDSKSEETKENYRKAALDMTEHEMDNDQLETEGSDETAPIHDYLNDLNKGYEYTEDFSDKPKKKKLKKKKQSLKVKPKTSAINNIFNEKMLQSLKDTLDKENLAELIKGFTDKSDELVEFLDKNQTNTDMELINEKAHELKGMAANFGMTELSDIAGQAEKAAGNDDLKTAQAALGMLSDANARAYAAITKWINQTD